MPDKKEKTSWQNMQAVAAQKKKWESRDRSIGPEEEEKAMEIARSFDGKDVQADEIKSLEPYSGICHYYVGSALQRLGYRLERASDQPRAPSVYTKKLPCPHCGHPLPPEITKNYEDN